MYTPGQNYNETASCDVKVKIGPASDEICGKDAFRDNHSNPKCQKSKNTLRRTNFITYD